MMDLEKETEATRRLYGIGESVTDDFRLTDVHGRVVREIVGRGWSCCLSQP